MTPKLLVSNFEFLHHNQFWSGGGGGGECNLYTGSIMGRAIYFIITALS